MKKHLPFALSFAILLGTVQCFAMNGVGVYTYWHYPFIYGQPFDGDASYLRGQIIAATIKDNAIIKRDTIFKDVGQCAAISPDGRRAAFFRWGVRLNYDGSKWTLVAGTAGSQCYLSVVGIDGSNLTNLIPVNAPCQSVSGNSDSYDGDAVLDWPAVDGGSWIYYEKPTKSREIWRINADNPSQNQLITTYNSGAFLRRWDLSLAANWSGSQSRGGTVGWSGASKFPLVNNNYNQSGSVGLVGCNPAVAASGNILAHYYGGNHTALCIEAWNHTTGKVPAYSKNNSLWAYNLHTVEDIQKWNNEKLFVDGYGGADLIRFSVNSDKWVMRMLGWCWQGNDGCGSNCVAVNWKDKQAINLSKNPPPSNPCGQPVAVVGNGHSKCADAGDLWIDFGAGNNDKWEDQYGVLRTYAQANIVLPAPPGCDNPADCPGSTAAGNPSAAAARPAMIIRNGEVDLRADARYSLRIADAHGRIVRASTIRGPARIRLDVPESGLYVVQVSANGATGSERLMLGR